MSDDHRGRVLKSTGKWYQVLMPTGEVVECRVRGKMKLQELKTTNPIAVGDIVILDPKSDEEGKRVIVDYELRENYIVRKSSKCTFWLQILIELT
jgi:ribosome biogenesis GTPase / thiamine phosphate phosphatase